MENAGEELKADDGVDDDDEDDEEGDVEEGDHGHEDGVEDDLKWKDGNISNLRERMRLNLPLSINSVSVSHVVHNFWHIVSSHNMYSFVKP